LEPTQKSVVVNKGGYSAYLSFQQARNDPGGNGSSNGRSADSLPKGRQLQEKTRAERRAQERWTREVAELEAIIEVTEQKLASLANELEAASSAQDVAKLQKLGQDYQDTEAELEALIIRWTDMEAA
jgi:predicted RNase H-like nuclease (RuvC/YqgF family)